jgi:hypothetical protein
VAVAERDWHHRLGGTESTPNADYELFVDDGFPVAGRHRTTRDGAPFADGMVRSGSAVDAVHSLKATAAYAF